MALLGMEYSDLATVKTYSSNTSTTSYNIKIYREGKLRILIGTVDKIPSGTDIALDAVDAPELNGSQYGITSYFFDTTSSSARLININGSSGIHFWNAVANTAYINICYFAKEI